MTIVSGKAIVQTARDHGYAVGAFNTNNLEWTQAILESHKQNKPRRSLLSQWALLTIWVGLKPLHN